jgi:hypothetical protein
LGARHEQRTVDRGLSRSAFVAVYRKHYFYRQD